MSTSSSEIQANQFTSEERFAVVALADGRFFAFDETKSGDPRFVESPLEAYRFRPTYPKKPLGAPAAFFDEAFWRYRWIREAWVRESSMKWVTVTTVAKLSA